MKSILKKILKWILHEHSWIIDYRIITYKEVLKRGKWKEVYWKEMYWHQHCETCGKKKISYFKSSLYGK